MRCEPCVESSESKNDEQYIPWQIFDWNMIVFLHKFDVQHKRVGTMSKCQRLEMRRGQVYVGILATDPSTNSLYSNDKVWLVNANNDIG